MPLKALRPFLPPSLSHPSLHLPWYAMRGAALKKTKPIALHPPPTFQIRTLVIFLDLLIAEKVLIE